METSTRKREVTGEPGTQGPGSVRLDGGSTAGDITTTTINYQGEPGEQLKLAIQNWKKLSKMAELDRFVGRDKAIAEIKAALAELDGGYILIKGPAGIGKTALAARLVESEGYIFHFAGFRQGRYPEHARKNIAGQLITRWDLSDWAPDNRFPAGDDVDDPEWLANVLDAAAAKRDAEYPEDADIPPLVVVVDGLDEALRADPRCDTDIPFGLPRANELPDRVFIIATCRVGTPAEQLGIFPERVVELTPESPDNIDDVRKYIEQFVRGDKADRVLSGRLSRRRVDPDDFIRKLMEKSSGSWLYVYYVMKELRSRSCGLNVSQLDTLPVGLKNFYSQQFSRWLEPRRTWEHLRLPVLATLAALPGPATAAEIARYAGLDRGRDVNSAARWLAEGLRPFLDAENGGPELKYQLAHRSLRDRMATDADLAKPATAAEGLDQEILDSCRLAHERIARVLMPEPLADLSQWERLPVAVRQALPRHAALGGLLGTLLPQAAFHLSCPSVEIFRVRGYLTGASQEAAVSALEMAQAHWGDDTPARDKAWWLHIWARRFAEDDLAASAWELSGRQESVVRAMWLGTPHRLLADGPPGKDRQPEHVWCVAPVELGDGTTALAAGTGSSIRLWNPATSAPIGGPMTGHLNTVQALVQIRADDGSPQLATGDADGTIMAWGLPGGPTQGVVLGTCTDLNGDESPVRVFAAARPGGGRSVLISGDGASEITGHPAQDGTVRRWDGNQSTPVGRHDGPVAALDVIHLAGRTIIASGGEKDGVRFWDLPAGPQPAFDRRASLAAPAILGPVRALTCIDVQDEAPVLVTAGEGGGEIQLWRIEASATGGLDITAIGSFSEHKQPIHALGLIPRPGHRPPLGPLVVSGDADGTLLIWDPKTLEPYGKPLLGHLGPVWAVGVVTFPDEGWTLLASAGGDRTLRLWDSKHKEWPDRQLHGHHGAVTTITTLLHPEHGELLASAGTDGTIRMWDVRDAGPAEPPRFTFAAHGGRPIASIAAITGSQDRAVLASGGDDRVIRVWDFAQDPPTQRTAVQHATAVTGLSGTVDGTGRMLLAFGDDGGCAETWNLASPHERVASLRAHDAQVLAISFVETAAGPTMLATGGIGSDFAVRLWNPETGQQADGEPFNGHEGWVRCIQPVTRNGEILLATGGEDWNIRIWDLRNRAEAGPPLMGHDGAVHSILPLELPGHPGLIASCGSDASVRLWDLSSAVQLGEPLIGHVGTVRSLALITGPHGPLLATAGTDHSIMLWDLRHRLDPGDLAREPPAGGQERREMDGQYAIR